MNPAVLETYDLAAPVTTFPVGQGHNSHTVGVSTANGEVICKRYQSLHVKESIRYECSPLRWLNDRGLPFPFQRR